MVARRDDEPRGGDRHRHRHDADTGVILYGWHTVMAALTNPARSIRKILATENALPASCR